MKKLLALLITTVVLFTAGCQTQCKEWGQCDKTPAEKELYQG